jgi:hypothetical protein
MNPESCLWVSPQFRANGAARIQAVSKTLIVGAIAGMGERSAVAGADASLAGGRATSWEDLGRVGKFGLRGTVRELPPDRAQLRQLHVGRCGGVGQGTRGSLFRRPGCCRVHFAGRCVRWHGTRGILFRREVSQGFDVKPGRSEGPGANARLRSFRESEERTQFRRSVSPFHVKPGRSEGPAAERLPYVVPGI